MMSLSRFLPLFAVTAVVGGAAAVGLPAGAQSTPVSGEALYRQRCQMCHQAVAGRPATLGPNLSGIVGRKAASTPFAYSAALKKSNLTWTSANLDRYLSGSARMIPGTKMAITISSPADRAALIAYLSRPR